MADTVSAETRATLVAMLRAAYPHPSFPDGPYERTADKILGELDASLWHRLTLERGLESLDARAQEQAGRRFTELDADAAYKLLQDIADAEFFAFIRGVAVVTLYDDHEVWELLGYEGPSFDQGGYLHRGFDDLDWLPDPRIEEYAGPEQLIEVAPDDQPQHVDSGTGSAR